MPSEAAAYTNDQHASAFQPPTAHKCERAAAMRRALGRGRSARDPDLAAALCSQPRVRSC